MGKGYLGLFLLLLMFMSIFDRFFETILGLAIVGFVDELLLSIAVVMMITAPILSKRLSRFCLSVTVILGYMIVVSLLFGKSNSTVAVIAQSIIHLKFFFFIFILKDYSYQVLRKFILFVFFFSLFGVFLNLLNPYHFSQFFDIPELERNSFIRLSGFEFHPNKLGFLFFIILVLVNTSVIRIRSLSLKTVLNVLIILVIVFTGSRTVYLLVLLTAIYHFWFMKSLYYRLAMIGSFALITLIFYSSFADNYFVKITEQNIADTASKNANKSSYIRGIMIYNGVQLSKDNFPIGTGVATYGSVLSSNSVVYDELGLSKSVFFKEMKGVYDSNLATILGELGIIGIILIGFLLAKARSYLSLSKHNFRLLIFLVALLSITQPVLMHTHSSLLIALLIYLLTKKGSKLREL